MKCSLCMKEADIFVIAVIHRVSCNLCIDCLRDGLAGKESPTVGEEKSDDADHHQEEN